MSEARWGTKEWFERKVQSDSDLPEGYFSHGVNGYQLYRHRWILKQLLNALPKKDIRNIVELGCGGGELLELIRQAFDNPTAVGMDFVESIIEVACERFPYCEFHPASLPNVSGESESVDLIIASEVLYYLTDSDQANTLRNVREILKFDGHVVITSAIGKRYLSAKKNRDPFGGRQFQDS